MVSRSYFHLLAHCAGGCDNQNSECDLILFDIFCMLNITVINFVFIEIFILQSLIFWYDVMRLDMPRNWDTYQLQQKPLQFGLKDEYGTDPKVSPSPILNASANFKGRNWQSGTSFCSSDDKVQSVGGKSTFLIEL